MKSSIRLTPPVVLGATLLIAAPVSSFGESSKIKLNQTAFAYAQELIAQGRVVFDKRNEWASHRVTAKEDNEFIRTHGLTEYERWHLGIDESQAEGTKARYKFPFGDFKNVHRSGLLAVKSRARQFGYTDIERAAVRLLGLLDSRKRVTTRPEHRLPVCAPSAVALR